MVKIILITTMVLFLVGLIITLYKGLTVIHKDSINKDQLNRIK